jgi:hypothetical protein
MKTKFRQLWLPLVTIAAIASGSNAWCQNKVVGAIWEITYELPQPVVHKFRGTPDGKIWNMPAKGTPRVIGKWSWIEKDVKVKMKITESRGRGDYELVQIGDEPPRWQGDCVNDKGRKIPIKVRLLRD